MEEQCTSHILMIKPVAFGFNEETALSNAFMQKEKPSDSAQKDALIHFNTFIDKLRAVDINVTVIEDTPLPKTPDSIFPNNWISFHADGRVILYPMEAPNRRLERKERILSHLSSIFEIKKIIDLSHFENEGHFLEGTGSLVLDRSSKVAYACLSSRTGTVVLDYWQNIFPEYQIINFHASDRNGVSIYHTNVMMCVADDFAVICAEAIVKDIERDLVIKMLKKNGKEPLLISLNQMSAFAGNMLQVLNNKGDKVLVMSQSAHDSFTDIQLSFLNAKTEILTAELGLIETLGGGSARCMMAELFLKKKM
jgi:hypothetical protein